MCYVFLVTGIPRCAAHQTPRNSRHHHLTRHSVPSSMKDISSDNPTPLSSSRKPSISSTPPRFLRVSAQNVGSDVTSTKQTTDNFLPGSTTTRERIRKHHQISLSDPEFLWQK